MKPLYNYKVGNKVHMPSRPERGEGIVKILHPQNSATGALVENLMAYVEFKDVKSFIYFTALRPTELPRECRAKNCGRLAR